MLYLHCGLAKTGTTTLQAALARRRSSLAAAGIIYPERWTANGDAHRLFLSDRAPETVIEDFTAFLATQADKHVVISNETFTVRLLKGEFRQVLVELISEARRIVPVRLIWSLRRLDDVIHSACLHRLILGLKSSLQDSMQGFDVSSLFAGMAEMSQAADEVFYVRYEPTGEYELKMLNAMGMPSAVTRMVSEDLEAATRLNVGLTHKKTMVLLNLEQVSARCGTQLDGEQVRNAFRFSDFQFTHDRRCDLFSGEIRQGLHQQALDQARKFGISAYEDFFEDADVERPLSPTRGDADSLSDHDLRHLVAHLAGLTTS
jgi:hypothetical protein